MLYSVLIFLIIPPDLEFLRYIRSIISFLLLIIIFRGTNNPRKILFLILLSLSLHSLAIYLSSISHSIQNYLAIVYNTRPVLNRYAGLTAGYDIAGFLTLVGFFLSFILFKQKKTNVFRFLMIFFLGSALFTSRTTSILAILIVLFLILKGLYDSRFNFKSLILSTIIITIFSAVLYKYVIPTLVATIELGILDSFSELGNENAVLSYSKDNPFDLLKNFIVLPDTLSGLVFGINQFPKSDSGYIQIINTIGVIGLLLIISFYLILSRFFKKTIISKIGQFIIILTFILSIKNQYFFTRGVFELLIILFCLNQSEYIESINNERD